MFSRLKKIYNTFSSRDGLFMFLRAQLASQAATWLDNLTAFALKKTFDFFNIKVIETFSRSIEAYVYATVAGQVLGGLLSCLINYHWTFKVKDLKIRYILIKFFLVWLGSLALNTYFTFYITERVKEIPWLVNWLSTNSDDIFIVVKLAVSLLVGFFWNYTMYRRFVFKDISFRS